jgi:hypothetical protein
MRLACAASRQGRDRWDKRFGSVRDKPGRELLGYTPAVFGKSAEAIDWKRVVKHSFGKERSERARNGERGGCTLRRDEKSAEVIGKKGDARCPSCEGVRKRLKTQRLDEGKGNWRDASGSGLGIDSMLEPGKHRAE